MDRSDALMEQNDSLLRKLKGKLIVSCQALDDEPLHGSLIMGRMALAAKMGGAGGIRANTYEDIVEIRRQVDLPIIGIVKKVYGDSEIYITPTLMEINELLRSPAEIIAMDATKRRRPGDAPLSELIMAVKKAGHLVMADISDYEEGIRAKELGFDMVSTTMSGYTSYTKHGDHPDFRLMRALSENLDIPVIAEGNIKTPAQLTHAFQCGVTFAIIGGAITRPQLITRDFVQAIPQL